MVFNPSETQSAHGVPDRIASGLGFSARRFGKVVDADIDLAPLTIFVGKNNTGKSYLATLVWCISSIHRLLQRKECVDIRPGWINDIFAGLDSVEFPAKEVTFDSIHRSDLLDWVNLCLEIAGREFFSEMFAFDGFAKARVAIRRASATSDTTLQLRTDAFPKGRRRQLLVKIVPAGVERGFESTLPLGIQSFDVSSYVISQVTVSILFGFDSVYMNAVYIPAARTGLMLAFPVIVSQLIVRAAPNSPEAARLQMPQSIIEFLSTLSYGFHFSESPTDEIANWLEQRLLGGTLSVTDESIPTITYKPNDAEFEIPLHAASSMITEVAPILLAMRRSFGASQLILEEPEAHLHLSAQRVMAQAIARLVNAGIHVLITTHSDTLIQQINNLMKLYRVGIKAGDGYEAVDALNPDLVRGYEFSGSGEGTHISQLEMLDEGLVVRSINETLIDLADETIDLNEALQND